MEFPERLKKKREEKGFSQYDLADRLFVSRSAVAKWEQGKGMPSEQSIKRMCELFSISEEELFASDEARKDYEKNLTTKMRSKHLFWAVTSLSVIALATCGGVAIAEYEKKKASEDATYVNTFFSDSTLQEYGLASLSIPERETGTNTTLHWDVYTCYSPSETDLVAYASSLFSTLQNNPRVSFLSFGVSGLALGHYSSPENLETFLYAAQDYNDCFTSPGNDGSLTWDIYYFVSFPSDHKKGEKVVPYEVSLRGFSLKNDEDGKTHILVQMALIHSDRFGIYIGQEFGQTQRASLNDNNISHYYSPLVEEDTGDFYFSFQRVTSKNISAYLDFSATFSYGSENSPSYYNITTQTSLTLVQKPIFFFEGKNYPGLKLVSFHLSAGAITVAL
jgi:Predicted transcriptional regulators